MAQGIVPLEDDVPLPRNKAAEFRSVMRDMKPGQSFIVYKTEINTVRNVGHDLWRREGKRFQRKQEGDFYRIWKIK